MILHGSDDLPSIAATNELRRWSALPLHAPSLAQLDDLLLHIYHHLRPKTIHYQQRRMLLDVFNKMASKIFGKAGGFPVVKEFGSFKMDLFTADSDLDLSVNFTDSTSSSSAEYPRAEKIKAIRKLSKTLYAHQKQGHVKGVMPIVGARVPVLKVTDCGTGIECDISIENKDGISRSAVISLVSSIDERFCILSYLMKLWAKANNINSSKDRTMSSMTIIALVAFHLQVEDFWDRSENFARSVGNGAEMEVINKCVQKALNYLTCFLSGEINSYELETCLFGPVRSTLSPIANMRDNKYSNGRLTWEDAPAPQIELDATPGQSKVDKKRKGFSREQSNTKRARYGVPPAEQAPPRVFDDHFHQRLGTDFHFLGYVERLPQIPYRVPEPYSTPTNLSLPHFGYGHTLDYPSRPGVEARRSHHHGPHILPSSNFSHRHPQPDLMYQYDRGFRE